jgi:tetratricopeptide (TPR) repeat protein
MSSRGGRRRLGGSTRVSARSGNTSNIMLKQLTRKLHQWFAVADREVPSDAGNATRTKPDPDWFERGLALRRVGNREAALECFQHAVESRHDDVNALVNQGDIQAELGRHEDAADCFELALAFASDSVDALLGLARLARDAGDETRALAHLQHAARIAPHSAEPYFELGRTYKRGGDTKAAVASYGRALEIDPDHFGSCVNTGLLHLAQLGDACSARQFFEHAVRLRPDSVAAQANLGLALQELGQFETALEHYNRLIEMYPDVVEYRWNRGIALLSHGDFANGWNDYELRHVRAGRSFARRFPFAEWDGTALSGRHILIYGEQGVGDEIMFASCVSDVLRGAQGVVIECDRRLAPLFRRSFPAARVHGAARDGQRDWLKTFPELSLQIAAGSLPRFFRRNQSEFPQHDGYLAPDAARRAYWQTRLAALGGGLKIGIGWHGGTLNTRRELRSLALADCLPLLQRKDCEFICLQSGDCSAEIAAARERGARLHWWPEAVRDIDELAGLISALDWVVAADSTIVHLGGALGQKVWVMLSASPEWRYLWRGERMPWYPALRLFRQQRAGDWQPVVETITAALGRGDRD